MGRAQKESREVARRGRAASTCPVRGRCILLTAFRGRSRHAARRAKRRSRAASWPAPGADAPSAPRRPSAVVVLMVLQVPLAAAACGTIAAGVGFVIRWELMPWARRAGRAARSAPRRLVGAASADGRRRPLTFPGGGGFRTRRRRSDRSTRPGAARRYQRCRHSDNGGRRRSRQLTLAPAPAYGPEAPRVLPHTGLRPRAPDHPIRRTTRSSPADLRPTTKARPAVSRQ